MAPTAIPITTSSRAGVAKPALVAADIVNNNIVQGQNGVTMMIECRNTHATLTRTIAFQKPGTIDGDPLPAKTITLAANQTVDQMFGPFPTAVYGTDLTIVCQTVDVTLRYGLKPSS